MRIALTIAGSDPSGGAGLQADLKTFHQHGVYGTSVVTLLTAQNTVGVSAVEPMEASLVRQQLDAVLEDVPPLAAKTGALGSVAVIETVADRLADASFPLVIDPVMVSKHGDPLMDSDAVEAFVERMLLRADLVTPNRFEAEKLSGVEIVDWASMILAADTIAQRGECAVLIKGLREQDRVIDLLQVDGTCHRLEGPWINTKSLHGTGCVLSAAIVARRALGQDWQTAVNAAKGFITRGIASAPKIGGGVGPIDFHASID
ncbi:MAG: bifunctional hydroxymethylpyrimidine kinase/phosphomethylpyrimidine kinase [Planctomycetota bacterium]